MEAEDYPPFPDPLERHKRPSTLPLHKVLIAIEEYLANDAHEAVWEERLRPIRDAIVASNVK